MLLGGAPLLSMPVVVCHSSLVKLGSMVFYIILDKFKLQGSDWPSFKVSLAMICRQE